MSRFRRPNPRSCALGVALAVALAGVEALGREQQVATADERKPKPGGPEADKDHAAKAFAERVNAAIDSGQKFLLATQRDDGTWNGLATATTANSYGEQALVLLALAKTGVEADHKPMRKGLAALDTLIGKQKAATFNNEPHTHATYSAACVAMLMDALHGEQPAPGPDGKPSGAKVKRSVPAAAKGLLQEIVTFYEAKQYGKIWRYPGGAKLSDQDLSATQYALMGLLTAGRLGLHAKSTLYRRALSEILDWQQVDGPEVAWLIENPAYSPPSPDRGDPERNPDEEPERARYGKFIRSGKAIARGWPYQKGSTVTGSMTCAGLSCLAIIKDRLSDERLKPPESLTKDEAKRIDKAIVDGFGWLSANYSVTSNPGASTQWHYYYLYGLERACSLMGMRHVGANDWYRDGATVLLDLQQDDGAWPAGGGSETRPTQSAFALLFLKRATSPTRFRAPAVTGGPDDEPTDGN